MDDTADEVADLQPGHRVGEYEVEGVLGRGGYGTVYSASHPVIGKRVAIKVLKRRFSDDADIVSRFVSEARAVNQIRHQHIIDIFAFGRLDDGRHYYVMEQLAGESLDAYLRARRALSPADALAILRPLALALDAAHAAGIVHRDLKPGNVWVARDADGRPFPKLLDFGIAKLLKHEPQPGSHRTVTGAPMGTPHYMSPEQCRGKDIDHRSDIYALGIMTYQLLTGGLPFVADNYLDILNMQLAAEPDPPSKRVPTLAAAIDAPVLAMMAKDPNARPRSPIPAMRALAVAANVAWGNAVDATAPTLEPLSTAAAPTTSPSLPAGESLRAGPQPRRGRRVAIAVGLASLATALAAVIILPAWSGRGTDDPDRPQRSPGAAPVTATPAPPPAGSVADAAVAVDAAAIAVVADAGIDAAAPVVHATTPPQHAVVSAPRPSPAIPPAAAPAASPPAAPPPAAPPTSPAATPEPAILTAPKLKTRPHRPLSSRQAVSRTALVIIALAIVPGVAQADAVREATLYHRAGTIAVEHGDVPTAIQAFEHAYRLAPDSLVLFNIIALDEQLFDERHDVAYARLALSLCEKYLAGFPSGPHRAEVEDLYRALPAVIDASAKLTPVIVPPPPAQLIVFSDATEARIAIDHDNGSPSPYWKTPVAPGDHVVAITGKGYQPLSEVVHVDAGTLEVRDFEPAVAPARIAIDAREHAQVTIDGADRGETPLPAAVEVPPGPHRVIVAARGRDGVAASVQVAAGDTVTVVAELPRTAQSTAARGVALGAAGALALGVTFGLLADHENSETAAMPPSSASAATKLAYNATIDRRNELAVVANTGYALGGAAALTAAALWLFDHRVHERLPIAVAPTAGGIVLVWGRP